MGYLLHFACCIVQSWPSIYFRLAHGCLISPVPGGGCSTANRPDVSPARWLRQRQKHAPSHADYNTSEAHNTRIAASAAIPTLILPYACFIKLGIPTYLCMDGRPCVTIVLAGALLVKFYPPGLRGKGTIILKWR